MMELDESYVEAVLEWSPHGQDPDVNEWLSSHDLQVVPMRAGLLINGTLAAFEAAFGVELENVEPPVQLPVPDELRKAVAAITIPPPRKLRAPRDQ